MFVETQAMNLENTEVNGQTPPSLEEINNAIITMIRAHSTGTLDSLYDEGHFGTGLLFFIDANTAPVQSYLTKIGKKQEFNDSSKSQGGAHLFGASLTSVCLDGKGKTLFGQMLADNLKGCLAVAMEKVLQDADYFLEISQEANSRIKP